MVNSRRPKTEALKLNLTVRPQGLSLKWSTLRPEGRNHEFMALEARLRLKRVLVQGFALRSRILNFMLCSKAYAGNDKLRASAPRPRLKRGLDSRAQASTVNQRLAWLEA